MEPVWRDWDTLKPSVFSKPSNRGMWRCKFAAVWGVTKCKSSHLFGFRFFLLAHLSTCQLINCILFSPISGVPINPDLATTCYKKRAITTTESTTGFIGQCFFLIFYLSRYLFWRNSIYYTYTHFYIYIYIYIICNSTHTGLVLLLFRNEIVSLLFDHAPRYRRLVIALVLFVVSFVCWRTALPRRARIQCLSV